MRSFPLTASISQGFGQDCPSCKVEKETLIHALKDYPTSRTILSIGCLDNSLISKEYHCCIDWLEDMLMKEEDAQVVWDRARTFSQDYCIFNLMNAPLLPANPAVKKWEKPPRGHVKINFDASISNNRINFGVIARDEGGFVIGGGGGFKD
ncbi:hypothetical protein Godav_029748 [Gossypium davidsonii]|uniref:RNase H type-1 domain-containing protein n=1 Tax=Gossypium davidsonii TaxID=34287 RepID=A0A7J8TDA3_GOSDV|nr:hypothetical protein [Gossypium davidsonii]